MLHIIFERAIACIRRILRALRARAHALFDLFHALVTLDPTACVREQVANILKKFAAAGLTVGGALLEPVVEAAVIWVAPWAAAAADVISAVLTASMVVVAVYTIGKLINLGLGVEEAHERHRISQTLQALGGRELLEVLARTEASETAYGE